MARQTLDLRPISIGIEAAGKRTQTDSMGELEVPASRRGVTRRETNVRACGP
jgi:hypothetical protein